MNGAKNPTESVAAQAGANASLSNRRDWEYFDKRLTELRVNDVENIIGRGWVLIEAHDELERGSYEATVKRHFDLSYARKLRIIAAHPVISNRAHVHALPPSAFTLYELTKLPAALLREKLKDGSINPKLERKEVARWRKGERGQLTVGGSAIEHRPSLAEQLRTAKAEIAALKNTAGGEHLFDPNKTSDREIAETMIGRLEGWRGRAARVAKLMLEILERRAASPPEMGIDVDAVANRTKRKNSTKH
jgi:hypothetical protein